MLIKPAGAHALCMCARCLHILRVPSTKETHGGASGATDAKDDDEGGGDAASIGRRWDANDEREALHVVACVCPTCTMTVQAPMNAPDGVCTCGACGHLLRVPAAA